MTVPDRPSDAEALAWLIAVGADEAIADAPVDRLRPAAPPLQEPPMQAPPMQAPPLAVRQPVEEPAAEPAPPLLFTLPASVVRPPIVHPPVSARPLGTPEAVLAARELAEAANTLDELKDAIARFDGLSLKLTATNLVFADGNPQARLMLVGEAPGAEEDRQGLPFVGASGQLLDRMLAAIGRDRSSCYITNIVNWRPPGNRKPSPAEMSLCLPFIARHIALVNPALVVLLGDTAAKTLTGRNEGITRMRGKWFGWAKPESPMESGAESGPKSAVEIPLLPTFHPAFLLRSPGQKREAWIDLLAIKRKLAELEG